MKLFVCVIVLLITGMSLFATEKKIDAPVDKQKYNFMMPPTAGPAGSKAVSLDKSLTHKETALKTYSAGGIVGLMIIGGAVGGVLLISSIVTSAVFTGLYAGETGDPRIMSPAMFASTSTFSVFLAGLLLGVKVATFSLFPLSAALFGVGLLLAGGTMASAGILTKKYLENDYPNRAHIITGMLWSYAGFGISIVTAITSLITLIVALAVYYAPEPNEPVKEQKVSLLLTHDSVGVRIIL